MATHEWIESAARPDKAPAMVGQEGFGATALAGATTIELHHPPDARRAARLAARIGEEAAEALGLAPPPKPRSVIAQLGDEALSDLLDAIACGDEEAREHVRGLMPIEVEAARAELARRRADR